MADRRLLPDQGATPDALRDAVTGALPHGSFQIDPMPLDGPNVLRISCRCGRCLRWVGQLPSDVLLWWLADHNDDMFLTPAQQDRKYGEQLPEELRDYRRLIERLKLPLLTRSPFEVLDATPQDRRPTDG